MNKLPALLDWTKARLNGGNNYFDLKDAIFNVTNDAVGVVPSRTVR